MRTSATGGAPLSTAVVLALLLGGLAPDHARAQDNSEQISGSLSVDFSHAYFFRGIRQEREGAVTQPAADIGWLLYREPGAAGLHTVSFQLGLWNSLHTGPSGSDGPATHVQSWYESDFFTGFTLGLDNWEAGVTYTSYMSPNGSFSSIQELALSLSMDDEAFFGQFAMNPHVMLAIELDGQADGGESEGVYLEFGVTPGLAFAGGAASLSFPATFGLSMSNYYESGPGGVSSGFGFFDIGADVAYPITIMPAGYGDWELSGGLHILSLGEYLEEVNEDDAAQVIVSFGVSMGF